MDYVAYTTFDRSSVRGQTFVSTVGQFGRQVQAGTKQAEQDHKREQRAAKAQEERNAKKAAQQKKK